MSSNSTRKEVLGQHTLVPTLVKSPELWAECGLTESKGKLPPYLIVVGDRRRADSAINILDNAVKLHDVLRAHGKNEGRVNITFGLYKGVPVAVAETQMGCPAVEINVRELLSSVCMTNTFSVSEQKEATTYKADCKYVIRVGSCAGINLEEGDQEGSVVIGGFDLIVCDRQVGLSGTDVQALSGELNFFNPQMFIKAKQEMRNLGYEIIQGDGEEVPVLSLDTGFTATITDACKQVVAAHESEESKQTKVHVFGNVTKDSLYAECNEESFCKLRKAYNVGTSEMELATLSRLAKEHSTQEPIDPVRAGMVCMCLGVIPGQSFFTDPARHDVSQELSLRGALEALAQVAASHKQ